ncbi:MAG: tetratricopeptide repeat protein [Treponema sp.]|nr:tetratricopeptide repeat protein [Treponema sp.]
MSTININPTIPDQNTFRRQYDDFLEAREAAVRELLARIESSFRVMPSRPSVKARVKDFGSYFKKYLRLLKAGKAGDVPLITDIIAVRIVCPFLEDLAVVEEILQKLFAVTEIEHKGGDHTFREFGYESIHLLVELTADVVRIAGDPGCSVAEVQIRTILQDAWAEVEHELVYKAEFTPFDAPMKRKLAAVNASLSLADIIFQEIRTYQRQLNGELGKRRESFFKKIEESTDALLFEEEKPAASADSVPPRFTSNESIDELLLNALYAHNKNQFAEAIAFYTRILELKPEEKIASLIYKHRGMAFFARSHYEEALTDFDKSLELDRGSYKSAYYSGIILAVLRKYPDAVEAFNKSLELNPYQPYCFYRRGQVYYHMEDYPQALADCESALALESFDAAGKFRQLLLNKLKM